MIAHHPAGRHTIDIVIAHHPAGRHKIDIAIAHHPAGRHTIDTIYNVDTRRSQIFSIADAEVFLRPQHVPHTEHIRDKKGWFLSFKVSKHSSQLKQATNLTRQFFRWLVGWLVDWLVVWMVGCLVG